MFVNLIGSSQVYFLFFFVVDSESVEELLALRAKVDKEGPSESSG